MGSGHILVYAFDVLMEIYLTLGYSERDAARAIVEYNLYGLEIDKERINCLICNYDERRQYDRLLKKSIAEFKSLLILLNDRRVSERISELNNDK